MLWAALDSKLRERGPLGFAGDLFELGVAISVLTAGMIAGAIVVGPLLILEYLTEGRTAARAVCK